LLGQSPDQRHSRGLVSSLGEYSRRLTSGGKAVNAEPLMFGYGSAALCLCGGVMCLEVQF
ncbi:MAG TPA: hypothetical protein VF074_18890, partial [Pyrinomonadaceae bacterium]